MVKVPLSRKGFAKKFQKCCRATISASRQSAGQALQLRTVAHALLGCPEPFFDL
jgi:hypothetical protein